MLHVLMRAEGRVVSAEDLLEQAWDEHADPFTNTVRVTVMTLRRKLGEPQPAAHGAPRRLPAGRMSPSSAVPARDGEPGTGPGRRRPRLLVWPSPRLARGRVLLLVLAAAWVGVWTPSVASTVSSWARRSATLCTSGPSVLDGACDLALRHRLVQDLVLASPVVVVVLVGLLLASIAARWALAPVRAVAGPLEGIGPQQARLPGGRRAAARPGPRGDRRGRRRDDGPGRRRLRGPAPVRGQRLPRACGRRCRCSARSSRWASATT
ncbi:hypothetical protein GCM10025868_01720 [Angustibacter aerolatus]|uniref:OmpR/PhoB-type domain-containing protein n=1 Tax=Angustibacter aerolatus TaxID=1162965 RepID=A0ABQ6JAW5_9ACTN|nr:winged helix-turn-helix domain-containing protein [Angustibacter aerolatus]GMA84922.1 hypothetical protein GCM10025868_01720 [Angustibacter aerolatus]